MATNCFWSESMTRYRLFHPLPGNREGGERGGTASWIHYRKPGLEYLRGKLTIDSIQFHHWNLHRFVQAPMTLQKIGLHATKTSGAP